jgi:drug/metabolite transporter (DMT)-like permease
VTKTTSTGVPTGGPDPATGSTLDAKVLVAIVVTVLAWASAFVVIRGVGGEISGGALALGRLLVGTAALALLLTRIRWVRMSVRDWLFVVAFGALWFGVYNVALNIAETTLDAGTTAMVVNIGPILIALGGGLILREGIPRWLAIGAGVAFVGVVLIGVATRTSALDLVGVLWALLAAVTYAAGVMFQKPLLGRVPAAQVTWLGCAVGALACLPFSGQLFTQLGTASPAAIAGMVWLGLVPTALGFTTWGYALQRMPAGRLGITTYVVPPIVIVLALILFGEVPPPLAVAGGVLCLVGVGLSRRKDRPRGAARR